MFRFSASRAVSSAFLMAGLMAGTAPAAFAQMAQPVVTAPMDVPAAEQRPLTLERVFASPALDGPGPRVPRLSPDGRYLTVLRNREDDRERYDLWAFDREANAWSMLVDSEKLGSGRELSEAEKMQRERARIGSLKGIVAYEWSDDGQSILVPLDGDLYLARLDGTVRRLTDSEAGELNPVLSPEGRYLSFVRDGRLFVGDVGAEAQAVTPPNEPETVHWGEAEFVAQEEMDRDTGYWWSPDERRIAVLRFDEARVGTVQRTAIGAGSTKVYEQRYPAAGTPNVEIALYVMGPDGSDRVRADLGENDDIYITRVDWAPDGSAIFAQRQNRAQTRMDMLRIDPATGTSTVLFTEEAAEGHWLNQTSNYRFLKDGSLIWWSERDGFGHLYRLADGAWTQLTDGDWVVTGLLGVDEAAGRLWLSGTKDGVLENHVYALDYAGGGAPVRLTEEGYSHGARMDKDAQALIVTRSSPNQPPQSYLADNGGKRLTWLVENRVDADHPYAPFAASHRPAIFGTIPNENGTPLYYKMILPEMEQGKRYPVWFSHYGGPHAQVVSRSWGGALQQAIVDKGYIWFEIDNRGSANRGVDFEKAIYRAMGSVEVRDQKTGAEWLKTLDYVDPDRIAIDGWSYGGYMTLKMLEADPGFYAAGISGAPVTKWELYDTHYTERYMGDPREVPDAYEAANAIADAGKIADPLLLIHGLSDDNVVFDNSSALISAMQEGGVPFEMMLYPGYTHRVSGPVISVHRYETALRFLEANGVPGGGR
ncbi:DPP IV N-terminal domain-containing protein [Croceicoccus sp. YJ47]|nr:DPP IV N-terminal domain-containing protein [Croceicoccus sp. YJ47]